MIWLAPRKPYPLHPARPRTTARPVRHMAARRARRRTCWAGMPTGRPETRPSSLLILQRVGSRHALRDDHAPGVDDQLAHLGDVDRRQPHEHPVVTEVGLRREHELLRLGADQPLALLLREREAHLGLVAR